MNWTPVDASLNSFTSPKNSILTTTLSSPLIPRIKSGKNETIKNVKKMWTHLLKCQRWETTLRSVQKYFWSRDSSDRCGWFRWHRQQRRYRGRTLLSHHQSKFNGVRIRSSLTWTWSGGLVIVNHQVRLSENLRSTRDWVSFFWSLSFLPFLDIWSQRKHRWGQNSCPWPVNFEPLRLWPWSCKACLLFWNHAKNDKNPKCG